MKDAPQIPALLVNIKSLAEEALRLTDAGEPGRFFMYGLLIATVEGLTPLVEQEIKEEEKADA